MEPSQTPLPGIWQPSLDGLLASLVVLVILPHLAVWIWVLVLFGKYGGNPSDLARIADELPLDPLLAWRLGLGQPDRAAAVPIGYGAGYLVLAR
ncbi:MAG TPA: hypothetical protein DDY43_15240 [Synechococcales bacterium UBA10510]|nr:hypothetical protein [Synechococcales bacterium UBA10510]